MADLRLQSNNPIIMSLVQPEKNLRPADSALGIFRSPDHDLCIPGRKFCVPENPVDTFFQLLGIVYLLLLELYFLFFYMWETELARKDII